MADSAISSDTIYAIATGTGGAIGVVRLSGPGSISAAEAVFKPCGHTPLSERPSSSLVYGTVVDDHGETLDDVVVSVYRAPHSYTGEDCIEFSCHNSPYVLHTLCSLLSRHGCRLAAPGEYTQRAFVNGKMDLSQAEAVADLISSTTSASHRLAIQQMKGTYSRAIRSLRDALLHIASLMELELDFGDHEELEFVDRSEVRDKLKQVLGLIHRLADSFRLGNAIKQGLPVAIVGDTNVGKSTLLNQLLGEDRAIVSPVQGTTRDVIEDTVNIGGHLFRFIDTAGLRHTDDPVEQIGIRRALDRLSQAQIILHVVDATQPSVSEVPVSEGQQLVTVYNKADLLRPDQIEQLTGGKASTTHPVIAISAKTGEGLQALTDLLLDFASPTDDTQGVIVSNLRHYQALQAAGEAAQRVLHGFDINLPTDLISQDLRECIDHLSDIIGEVTSDDVIHNIFAHFCVGK